MNANHLDDSALQGLADGTLRGPEGLAGHAHCDSCAECGEALAVYASLSTRLSALRDPPVPADFTASVLAAIDVREAQLSARRQTWLAALPAAAVAMLAVIGWALSAGLGAHVDRLVSGVTVGRHVLAALVPVIEAARLPLGLSALAISAAILFLLVRTLRGSPDGAAVRS